MSWEDKVRRVESLIEIALELLKDLRKEIEGYSKKKIKIKENE